MTNSNFSKDLHKKMVKLEKLVSRKNTAYGDSITSSAEIFKMYYPNGIRPDQYGDILLMVRILDKLSRIANKKKAFKENPFEDILGYSIRGCLK